MNQKRSPPFLNKASQGKRAKASYATPMNAFQRYFKNLGMEKKAPREDVFANLMGGNGCSN